MTDNESKEDLCLWVVLGCEPRPGTDRIKVFDDYKGFNTFAVLGADLLESLFELACKQFHLMMSKEVKGSLQLPRCLAGEASSQAYQSADAKSNSLSRSLPTEKRYG